MSVFETAVYIVQNLPKDGPVKTSTDEKLNFYALFKQATSGNCDIPKPSFYDIQGVYKWNAWKKLDQMTSQEAQQKYVDAIVQKIRDVQKTYKTEEWMKGDTFEMLGPKLEVLGIKFGESEIVVESSGVEDVPEELENEETTIGVLSDNEYVDALDDEIHSRSSSFTEPHTSPRHRASRQDSPTFKNSCHRLEKKLKVITESIDKLGKAIEERHNLLIDLVKKATVYVLVPPTVSKRTIIFFIFWPFLAHFIIRWARRLYRLLY